MLSKIDRSAARLAASFNLQQFSTYVVILVTAFQTRRAAELSLAKARISNLLLLSLVLGAMSCGAGGAGSGSSFSPTPDFSLSLNPSSLTIPTGSASILAVSVSASNGFTSPVSVQISGMPSGVSTSPATITVSPGTPLRVTLSAASAAALGKVNLTFTGTAVNLRHAAQLGLSVIAGISAPVRTRYTRTDGNTNFPEFINRHWMVYHRPTNRFFVTDPATNHVFVLDASTQEKIGTLEVPGAFSVDQTADEAVLWIGTQIGDVYTADPVAMRVTKRYIASQIGPFGFQGFEALPLADGRVALLGGQGGIANVDGYAAFALWNPVDNSAAIYATPYGAAGSPDPNIPYIVVCQSSNIGSFQLTPNRKSILLGMVFGEGAFCLLDTTTGKTQEVGGQGSVISMAQSPDGNLLVLADYATSQAFVYDARTLNLKSQFKVLGDLSSAGSMIFSRDSQTLFISGGAIIYAYNIASQQLIGWLPGFFVAPSSGCIACSSSNSGPAMQAIDDTGLIAGPMEEGVGFIDSMSLRTGPVGTQFTNAYLSPAFGSVSGGTSVQWSAQSPADGNFNGVLFGTQPAATFSYAAGNFNATTPAGKPGPVDIYAYASDGGIQIVPEGFSYGPWILQASPDASTVEGGGQGALYGYGFGPVIPAPGCQVTPPPDLQISVGGKPATITSFRQVGDCNASPPFPLQAVLFTMPSGKIGPADITVTNSSGSATLPGGIHYLPPVQQFVGPSMSLAQGIYDPRRDLYYFTDVDRIQVFSRTKGQWLSPITLFPSPLPNISQAVTLSAATTASHRLWGISLSPDGSKLAVGDAAAGEIFVLDPNTPTLYKTFSVPLPVPGVITAPAGLAISDAGIVYFATYLYGGTGYNSLFKLDTTTGRITDYRVVGPGLGYNDAYLRVVMTSDGTHAFFNDDGQLVMIETATDKLSFAADGPHCCYGDYDLTLSSNQTSLFGTEFFFDTNLNGLSYLGLNHREILDANYLYGAKLSPDGSLLFQPTTTGFDVFDGHLGILRTRISLSVQLSQGFDTLVGDGKDNILVAITGQQGSGIAVIDLSSLPEPPAFVSTSNYAPEFTSYARTMSQPGLQSHSSGRTLSSPSMKHLAETPRTYRSSVRP